MARLTIGRTIVQTICDVNFFDHNNELQHATVELYGNYTIDDALKPALKALDAKGGVVTEVKHRSFYGTMAFKEFAENCDKKNYKEW